jgi:hypothetical protein
MKVPLISTSAMRKAFKRIFFTYIIVFSPVVILAQELLPILKAKLGENVEFIDSSRYREFYSVKYRQLKDHKDSSKGFFEHQMYIGHNDATKPMVMIMDGYEVPPVNLVKNLKSEVTDRIDANQMIIEQRYFGASLPDNNKMEWLTYDQIASDYHSIKNLLKDVYTDRWIGLGISKGGLNSLSYNFFYPGDVDATIVYVTPILNNKEDKRINEFLTVKRLSESGKVIFDVQMHLLRNKKKLLPVFSKMVKDKAGFEEMFRIRKDLKLPADIETLYDLGVLEFDFNYWQYIGNYERMVTQNKRIFETLANGGLKIGVALSDKDSLVATLLPCIFWMVDSAYRPFLHQVITENGFYGYSEHLFKPYLKNAKYSIDMIYKPQVKRNIKYITEFNSFLKKRLSKTLFIYGGDDPYTAAFPTISENSDVLKIINPGTNHTTKIKDLSSLHKKLISDKLSAWLSMTVSFN